MPVPGPMSSTTPEAVLRRGGIRAEEPVLAFGLYLSSSSLFVGSVDGDKSCCGVAVEVVVRNECVPTPEDYFSISPLAK